MIGCYQPAAPAHDRGHDGAQACRARSAAISALQAVCGLPEALARHGHGLKMCACSSCS